MSAPPNARAIHDLILDAPANELVERMGLVAVDAIEYLNSTRGVLTAALEQLHEVRCENERLRERLRARVQAPAEF